MMAQPSQLSRRVRSIRHGRTASDQPDEPERRRRGAPCRRFCSAALAAGVALVLLLTLLPGLPANERQPRTEAESTDLSSTIPDTRLAAPAETAAASAALLHVVLATDEEAPFGLLGAVNSTVAHCGTPRALRFHLIVPNERRAPLHASLQSTWPSISFRTYSLDTAGVRAKITRHLRPADRGPVFVSPFRLAVAYLPLLLPNLRRVLWLHTDVLVFGDVAELLLGFRLRGAPAAAVPDCSTPVSSVVDTSRGAAVRGSDCAFNPALMLLDLRQWQLLDVPSRVEYWMGLNGRGGAALYRHDAAFPPVLLGLLPLYARLPPEWGVGHASRRRLREDELLFWRAHWGDRGVSYKAADDGPVLILTGGGRAGPRAKALHYHGRLKPWLLEHKPGVEAICRELPAGGDGGGGGAGSGGNGGDGAASSGGSGSASSSAGGGASVGLRLGLYATAAPNAVGAPIDVPCRLVWEAYAGGAAAKLGWQRRTTGKTTHAAEAVALAEARVEPIDLPALPPLEPEGSEAAEDSGKGGGVRGGGSAGVRAGGAGGKGGGWSGGPTHVAIVCSEATPYGLVAAINSTIMHAAPLPARPAAASLRFHVLVPPGLQPALARKLVRIFPPPVRLSVASPPADKLAKLGAKLTAVGVTSSPFDWPLLWLHLALPAEAKRVLLLPPDALVRTDVRELTGAALAGRAAAAFEDCSTTFEALFNYRHPLFKEHHGRSSCSVDPDFLVLDLRAWKRDDAPQRLLELVGFQRRNENLFLQPLAALGPAVPAQLLLDKRALRLPSRWLARGLARDGWSYSEAVYWRRYWGLQGVAIPSSTKPVRAPHVAVGPRREAGDALLLRFSGGSLKPWLRRCGGPGASGVPLCGRAGYDCSKLWLRQVSEEALRAIEATEADTALASSVSSADAIGVRRACVTDLALRKRAAEVEALVFDADSAFEPRGMARVPVGGADARRAGGGTHGEGSPAHGGGSGSAAGKGSGPRASSSHPSSSHQSSSHPSASHQSSSHHSHASSSPHHSSPTRQSHSPISLHHAASTHPASSPRLSHAPSAGGAVSDASIPSHAHRSSSHPSGGGSVGGSSGRPGGSSAGKRAGSAGDRAGGGAAGSRRGG